MENKNDRQWKLEGLWHRHQDTTSSRSPVATFFREHKQSLLAGMLLCVLLVLLFGIFSQLQISITDTPQWCHCCKLQHICGAGESQEYTHSDYSGR